MKIQLRPLQDEDANQIAALANNKNIWNNVRDMLPHPYSLKDAEFFISLTKKEDPKGTFMIEVDGEMAGMIGLHPQTDVYRKSAELGYWIGEEYWGKGIATEAIRLIVEYGFNTLDVHRIFAGVFGFNEGSMKVLEKNGFVKEGIFKNAVFKNNQFTDEHRYAKLRKD